LLARGPVGSDLDHGPCSLGFVRHPWMMWGLVAVASPASLLVCLALCRLLQCIFTALKEIVFAALKVAFGLLAVVLSIVMIGYVLPLLFPESPWAFALRYSTDGEHVQVLPKPADCDFLRAPIGLKGCHYRKSVQVTRYSKDARTNQPMVPYDDGHSWSALSAGQKTAPLRFMSTGIVCGIRSSVQIYRFLRADLTKAGIIYPGENVLRGWRRC
jgi:hypothetical protein